MVARLTRGPALSVTFTVPWTGSGVVATGPLGEGEGVSEKVFPFKSTIALGWVL